MSNSKYLKSPAAKNMNHVKHKQPRVSKNATHAKNIAKAEEFMREHEEDEEFFDDGKRRMKGYQHTQRQKITLSFITMLEGKEKWATKRFSLT